MRSSSTTTPATQPSAPPSSAALGAKASASKSRVDGGAAEQSSVNHGGLAANDGASASTSLSH
jgi:hypothetical protein